VSNGVTHNTGIYVPISTNATPKVFLNGVRILHSTTNIATSCAVWNSNYANVLITGAYVNEVQPQLVNSMITNQPSDHVVNVTNANAIANGGRTNFLIDTTVFGAGFLAGKYSVTIYDSGHTAQTTNVWIFTQGNQKIDGVLTRTNIILNGGSMTLAVGGAGGTNWVITVLPPLPLPQFANFNGGFALVSDEQTIVETGVTTTELEFLSGVTSPIQAQLSNDVRVAAGANVTVTKSGAGGIMTYTVAATGGAGSTAFSNLVDVSLGSLGGPLLDRDTLFYNLAGGFWYNQNPFFQITYTITVLTNITINVGTNMEQSVAVQTSNSFGVVYSGTPMPGERYHIAVFNTNRVVDINMTNNSYNPLVASNVTIYTIKSNSIASFLAMPWLRRPM